MSDLIKDSGQIPSTIDPSEFNINTIDKNKLERHKMILKINKYQASQRFGHIMKEYGITQSPSQLEKMSDVQLNDVYTKIKAVLSNQIGGKFYDNAAKGLSSVCENMITPYYDIEGFTQILFMNPEFIDCLEELKIESDLPTLNPKARLMFIVAQTMVIANTMNKMKKGNNQLINPENKKEIINEDNEQPIDIEEKKDDFTEDEKQEIRRKIYTSL